MLSDCWIGEYTHCFATMFVLTVPTHTLYVSLSLSSNGSHSPPSFSTRPPLPPCRSPHGTVYVTAATPLPLLPARLARYLYHQAALIGLAPEDLLRGALNAALEKAGVPPAPLAEAGEEAETMATADGRALHQLPLLGPWNVYRSALLPTPVRTLYMDMLVRCLYVYAHVAVCDHGTHGMTG